MARLFPFRSPVTTEREEHLLYSLTDPEADAIYNALSSRMTREVLDTLYRNPRPPSEIAEAIDTSLQNVRYHLDKLLDAELVTVVDTWYSERGVEMDVYAPTNEAIVLVAGDTHETTERQLLGRLLGAVSVVIGGFLSAIYLVQSLARNHARGGGLRTTSGGTTSQTQPTLTASMTPSPPHPGVGQGFISALVQHLGVLGLLLVIVGVILLLLSRREAW